MAIDDEVREATWLVERELRSTCTLGCILYCGIPWPRRPLIPSYMSQATCSRPKRLALVPSDLLSPQATRYRAKRLALVPSDSLSPQATRSRPKRLAPVPSDSLSPQATRLVPSDSLSPQATCSRPKRLALVTCPKRLKRPTRSTFHVPSGSRLVPIPSIIE